jgi:hypothetical protein
MNELHTMSGDGIGAFVGVFHDPRHGPVCEERMGAAAPPGVKRESYLFCS